VRGAVLRVAVGGTVLRVAVVRVAVMRVAVFRMAVTLGAVTLGAVLPVLLLFLVLVTTEQIRCERASDSTEAAVSELVAECTTCCTT